LFYYIHIYIYISRINKGRMYNSISQKSYAF
jgi:hypothetical protein